MKNSSEKHANKLLGILVVTLIFSVMNGTMFNVALPEISKEFSLLPSEVSWIMIVFSKLKSVGTINDRLHTCSGCACLCGHGEEGRKNC